MTSGCASTLNDVLRVSYTTIGRMYKRMYLKESYLSEIKTHMGMGQPRLESYVFEMIDKSLYQVRPYHAIAYVDVSFVTFKGILAISCDSPAEG